MLPMPPAADSDTLVPDITGLLAFAPTVMAELAPVATTEVAP